MQKTNIKRRRFMAVIATGFAAYVLPLQAVAAVFKDVFSKKWNKAAFEETSIVNAGKSLQVDNEVNSQDIEIIAPDKAENGAVVQVEITSNIANTESILILVEKNPTALIATFNFAQGALPVVITRIKMAEDSNIKVIVKANNQYFYNSKKVIVLENGCG